MCIHVCSGERCGKSCVCVYMCVQERGVVRGVCVCVYIHVCSGERCGKRCVCIHVHVCSGERCGKRCMYVYTCVCVCSGEEERANAVTEELQSGGGQTREEVLESAGKSA